MSPPGAGPVRVLIDDREVRVDSLADVVQLARDGRIDARTQVSLPGSRSWQPASSIPAVAAVLPADADADADADAADPWAAWDDMDDSAADDALEAFAERTDEVPLPAASLDPLDDDVEPLEEAPSVEELPSEALQPVADRQAPARPKKMVVRRPKPKSPSGGKVIAFPAPGDGTRRARRPAQSSAQPAEELVQLPQPARLPPVDLPDPRDFIPSEPPRPVGTRWWRVALVLGVSVVGMLMVNWYVTWTAGLTFPPAGAVAEPASPVAAAAAPAPAVPVVRPTGTRPSTAVDSPYIEMEAELRALLLDSPRDIATDGQLEDALLIELRRLRVQTHDINAPVLTWGGRKRDVPQSAEIHIHYDSRPGELDRELGGIGLVVGRYVHTYALEVPQLDVIIDGLDGGPRLVTLDPEDARKLYLRRTDLDAWLKKVRGH